MASALKTRANRFRSYAALREPDGHVNVIFPWQARLTPRRRGENPRGTPRILTSSSWRQPCLPRKDNVYVAVRFPQCGIGTEAICACFQGASHGEHDGRPSQNCNAQNCIGKDRKSVV